MNGFLKGLIGRRVPYGKPSFDLGRQFNEATRIGKVEIDSLLKEFVVRIHFRKRDFHTAEGRDTDIGKAMQKALDQAEEFLS